MIHEACKLWRQGWDIQEIKRHLNIKGISTLELLVEMANSLGYNNHMEMIEKKFQ